MLLYNCSICGKIRLAATCDKEGEWVKKFLCFVFSLMLLTISAGASCAVERVALLLEGGDHEAMPNGFNGQCVNGLELASQRYARRIQTKVYNALRDRSALEPLLRSAASESDLVIITSARYVPALSEIKEEFPECRFVAFDCDLPGVTTIQFKEEEGAFLAGALAALLTRETEMERINGEAKIGIIIGEDVPPTKRYLLGYRAGAWYISPEVEVLCEYTGSFTNGPLTEAAASKLRNDGANVIFCAVGPSSTAAVINAESRGYWCIGVDVELEQEFPDAVLASVVKRSGLVVSKIVEYYMNGELPEGGIVPLGLEYGCIDLSTWTREAKVNIPVEVREEIDEIADKIKDGLIVINGKDFGAINAD